MRQFIRHPVTIPFEINACQQADLAGACLQQQHRHQGHGGQTQLLGRLCQQIGQCQALKGTGQGA